MSTFKTFLINDKKNRQDWQMSRETILKTAQKWIGVHGILHKSCAKCEYEHNSGQTLQEALAKSQDKAVTRITNVIWNNSTNTLFAEHEIIDPSFNPVLCDGKVWSVSPSIWNHNPEDKIVTEYTPIHLAFLSIPPAYSTPAEFLEKTCVCNVGNKPNIANTCSTDMDESKNKEEKPKEDPQKMSMEDEMHEMHAMMKEMHGSMKKAMAPKDKEEEDKPKEKTAAAPEQKKASAMKSFDWITNSPTPKTETALDDVPIPY